MDQISRKEVNGTSIASVHGMRTAEWISYHPYSVGCAVCCAMVSDASSSAI